jgi:hypothetical protein
MPEYRAYTLGEDGHFIGFEPLVCASDEEAVERARLMAKKFPIELWSGPRLVTRLAGGAASTHEIHEGRMVPKPTS